MFQGLWISVQSLIGCDCLAVRWYLGLWLLLCSLSQRWLCCLLSVSRFRILLHLITPNSSSIYRTWISRLSSLQIFCLLCHSQCFTNHNQHQQSQILLVIMVAIFSKIASALTVTMTTLKQKITRLVRNLTCRLSSFFKDTLAPTIHTLGRVLYTLARATYEVVKRFAEEHPYIFALIVVGFLLAIIFPPVLGAVGFGAAGPVAGKSSSTLRSELRSRLFRSFWLTCSTASAAAAWQSSIGASVGAGSAFAIFQSAAMGGYGALILLAGSAFIATVVTGFVILFSLIVLRSRLRSRSRSNWVVGKR